MFETIKRELNEFRNFAIKGNIVDMAVGIIIGASFSGVVNSLVNDIIMPPMGWLMGKVDFTNLYILLPTTDEPVKISYGIFINSVISFLIMAFAVFLLIRGINKLQALAKKQEEAEEAAAPTTKECPRCKSEIHIEASKCPHCTADI